MRRNSPFTHTYNTIISNYGPHGTQRKDSGCDGRPPPAAVATIAGGLPAVRFMVLSGFPDMTLVGGTMKGTHKVGELTKNPHAAIAI